MTDERPTGTIFELDVFCDQMFRLADERFSAERHDELLRELAAELRGLIDNVQAQYCPPADALSHQDGEGR